MNDLIVLSHLRWEFVYQRPQHIINRLGKNNKVLFIEEPISFFEDSEPAYNVIEKQNIFIIQPILSKKNTLSDLIKIIKNALDKFNLNDMFLWFYSPAYHGLTDHFAAELIIYDCMDELSAFKNASPDLIQQEMELIKKADIVFTGGKSLYEAKKKFTNNIHCFPSSVDQHHFASWNGIMPLDLIGLKSPIIGYYGVIDERINLELLDEIANIRKDCNFIMIGPVVKISMNDLPTCHNIFYLGQKDYQSLPNYLHHFDICMMPFALNESTRFISPTKTLEFMAATKPIISTNIIDVKRDYSHVIRIIHTAEDFSHAINYYLNENNIEKKSRLIQQNNILAKTSWDATVAEMSQLLKQQLIATV